MHIYTISSLEAKSLVVERNSSTPQTRVTTANGCETRCTELNGVDVAGPSGLP